MSNSNTQSRGIGLFGFIFLIFLILKLGGFGVVATWSWWWVTAPLWAPLLAGLGIWAVIAVVALLFGGVSALVSRA